MAGQSGITRASPENNNSLSAMRRTRLSQRFSPTRHCQPGSQSIPRSRPSRLHRRSVFRRLAFHARDIGRQQKRLSNYTANRRIEIGVGSHLQRHLRCALNCVSPVVSWRSQPGLSHRVLHFLGSRQARRSPRAARRPSNPLNRPGCRRHRTIFLRGVLDARRQEAGSGAAIGV